MRLADTSRDSPEDRGGGLGGGGDIDVHPRQHHTDIAQDATGSPSAASDSHPSADGMRTSAAQAQTRGVFIEPGPGHWIGPGGEPVMANPDERSSLWRLLHEEQYRLVVLPEHPGCSKEKDAAQAKAQWLDRLNGGAGCWAPLTGKKVQR